MADPSTYRPAPGSIPASPGVYRFRDARGRVVYVGKAKSLRSRLTSYFQDLANLHPRTATMVTTAASVEWTVVNTEVEALQLEYSWIKEFDPRFNVKYRDDKSYPWLAVTVNEQYPRVWSAAARRRRGCATSARTRTPGRSGRPSTCCYGSSRCGPAPAACSSGRRRSAGPACSAISASAPRRVSAGSATTSTAASSRTSATSWPGRRPGSSSGSRSRCTPRRRTSTSSGPPGCATTSAR